MQELVQMLGNAVPGARLELTEFPSGAWNLDIHVYARFFVVQHAVGEGYGVSEVADSDELTGHDTVVMRVEDVWDLLHAQLGAPDIQ